MSEIFLDDLMQKSELVSPWDYQYWKGLKNRRILLMGEINGSLMEEVIIPLLDMDDGSDREIEIIVDSEGGDVISLFNLIDVLDTIKTPVHIRVLNKCLSAALLLLLGGKNNPKVRVTCLPNSVGLLHAGSVCLGMMDAKAADDTMGFYKRYDDKIKNLVLERSKVDSKLYSKMSKKEWYMFGDELLKYGFVDTLENHAEGGEGND